MLVMVLYVLQGHLEDDQGQGEDKGRLRLLLLGHASGVVHQGPCTKDHAPSATYCALRPLRPLQSH